MILLISSIIFAVCFAILCWTYAFYGIVLRLLSPYYKPIKKGNYEPYISIILPTYNEESIIGKKIDNTQWLTYPIKKREIIVVDSNSTDRTIEEAMKFEGVKIIRENERLGKSHAINTALGEVTGEIILITDADCLSLRRDALLKMVQNFADSSVGAVAAPIIFSEHKDSVIKKGFVRSGKDSWIRPSLLDSIVTGFGEFLSFRKELVTKLDVRCLSDDVDISMQVRRKGYRVIADSEIEMEEPAPREFKEWYSQIVRRKLNGYTSLWHKKSMLFNPRYSWYGMMIMPTSMFFHNLSPFLLLACFFAGFVLNMFLPIVLLTILLVASVFSQLARKFLIIQVIDLHAWTLYALRKHKAAWKK